MQSLIEAQNIAHFKLRLAHPDKRQDHGYSDASDD